jgi:O-antigen/teichoic acid export membrane protein
MTGVALMLVTFAGVPAENRRHAALGLLAASSRYFLSALGPITISAAHFVAALVYLHFMPRATFGLFSFLLVVAPFCLSLCGSMFAPPIAREVARPEGITDSDRLTLFKASLVFSIAVAVVVGTLTGFGGATFPLAAIFGLYGGLMSLRWFGRCWTYAQRRPARVLASDLAYSVLLTLVLLALAWLHRVTVWSAALAMLGSAAAGFLAFDFSDLRDYARALRSGTLGRYADFWRELSRWALLGVVMSEATANANAYLVTFISGTNAFAVLAVGALLMRPASLVVTALPDMERPLMSRNLRAGNPAEALQIVKEFRTATGAIWFATILLAMALLTWFPRLLLKHDYAMSDVVTVVSIAAATVGLRALRAADAVLLQAAGQFRALAGAGMLSSAVSLAATLVVLQLAGPVWASLGVLVGEIVATRQIFVMVRKWKRAHV